jgi:hypothetical protein
MTYSGCCTLVFIPYAAILKFYRPGLPVMLLFCMPVFVCLPVMAMFPQTLTLSCFRKTFMLFFLQ